MHQVYVNWTTISHHCIKLYIVDQSDDKMKEANDNGVNVVSKSILSTDNTHKVDNIQARYVLENVIGEAEIQMLKSLKESKISVFETRKQDIVILFILTDKTIKETTKWN